MTGPNDDAGERMFLGLPGPVALAHRGYAVGGAENSMAAFAAAVAIGYRAVETDVRTTADGVALAFHDTVLDRVCDRPGVIASMSWRDVARARIAGREPIPRLDELLGAWPELRVNIDVKAGSGVAPVLAAVARTGARDRVCLGAFSDARMRRIRRRTGPGVATALAPAEVVLLRTTARAGPARVRAIVGRRWAGRAAQVPLTYRGVRVVDAAFVAGAHAAGVVVHVWTVNEAEPMRALLGLGVDGLITDRAEVLRSVLYQRGQWPD